MSRPKVSVVIPVYNVEKYLGECLDSVLRQTFRNLEIICVDDGSTDSSPEILADYAAKDSRIKVITQRNAGLSAARNAGMDAASGKYIYFLDSDDYITDDAMERCVEICERDGLDQLSFGCSFLFEDPAMSEEKRRKNMQSYRIPEELRACVASGIEMLDRCLDLKYGCVCIPLRFYNLESLRRNGLRFCSGLLHEDDYFTPLSLMAGGRVEMVGDEFYVRRYRPGSIVTQRGADAAARRFLSRIEIMRLHRREFAERGYAARYPETVEKQLRYEYARLVRLASFPVVSRVARVHPVTALVLWLRHLARKARRRLCPKKK